MATADKHRNRSRRSRTRTGTFQPHARSFEVISRTTGHPVGWCKGDECKYHGKFAKQWGK